MGKNINKNVGKSVEKEQQNLEKKINKTKSCTGQRKDDTRVKKIKSAFVTIA